jgi:hypothetical protein
MPAEAPDGLSSQVRQQLEELLGDPAIRQSLLGGAAFTPEARDTLETLNAQVGSLLQDRSLGGILNGPQWLSGVSIVNGTVTAPKISVTSLDAITVNSGSINVTGTLTAAAAFPATGARVVLDSSGLWGYSGAATTTFKLNTDGSGSIGSGATAASWTTGGVLTIPVAAIGSLTIAAVGGGVLGGTYQTATTGAHINLSSTGIVVYNATSEVAANETFKLLAATGAVTATGSFTIKSAATGAHITVDNAGGIAGYLGTTENATNRTFLINAVDGSGHLGLNNGTPAITWSAAGAVSIGGSAMSAGKIVAGSLSVSTLSAISANMGTLTAGSITGGTITADTITTGTLTAARVSGGTLGGSYSLGAADITVNSTGKIKFGTSAADYLANDLLHFEVGTSETAVIEFKNAANTPYERITGWGNTTNSNLTIDAYGTSSRRAQVQISGGGAVAGETSVYLICENSSSQTVGSYGVDAAGNHSWVVDNGATAMSLARTNRALTLYGRLYPGSGSGSQATRYIWDNGTETELSGALKVNFANGGSANNWSAFTVANVPDKNAGYFKVNLGGTIVRVPFWLDA